MRTAPTGCLSLLFLGVLLLFPFFLANAFLTALAKLGLGPTSSLLVALGIFLGGVVNIPVTRIEQTELVEYRPTQLLGLDRLLTRPVQRQSFTIIAVNLGGCLVPTALAGYQIGRLALRTPSTLLALGAALALNVALCYYFATPVPQQGIALQPVIPAGAAALTGLLLAPEWAPPSRSLRASSAPSSAPICCISMTSLRLGRAWQALAERARSTESCCRVSWRRCWCRGRCERGRSADVGS